MNAPNSRIKRCPPETHRLHRPLDAYRAHVLTVAHTVRPELAVMIASLAFGGGDA